MAKKGEDRTETVNHSDTDTNGNTTNPTKGTSTSNKPIRVFRLRGVKVAVFENHTADGIYYKASPQKIYRDEAGAWKTNTSFGRDDLAVLQLLVEKAWVFILEAEAEANRNKEDQS